MSGGYPERQRGASTRGARGVVPPNGSAERHRAGPGGRRHPQGLERDADRLPEPEGLPGDHDRVPRPAAPDATEAVFVNADVTVPFNKKRRRSAWYWLAYVVLVPSAILFVAPFAWLISASFQNIGEIFSWPPSWIPENPSTSGYQKFLGVGPLKGDESPQAWRWFLNSAFVACSVTVLQLFFNSLAAYVFAKREFPGKNAIFLLFLATMMIPGQITLIPNYLVIKHVPLFGGNNILGQGGSGWLDSYWGLIMPGVVSAFGIFLLRQYMVSIPDELLDAARIDGANEFSIYFRVVLPLCGPALAATGIFTFQGAWEDFFWPLIIVSSPDKYTAPLGLALFVVEKRTQWDILFSGSVIATLPMIIVFIIFQRRFIQGISVSGLKG